MKDIKVMLRDALDSNGEYQELMEKMKSLRENKKRVETAIKEGFSSEMQNIQDVRVVVRYNHGTRFEEVTPCKSRYSKFLWNSPYPPFVEALLRMGRMK